MAEQFSSRNLTLPKVNMRLVGLVFAYVQKKYDFVGKPFTNEVFLQICKGENIYPIAAPIETFAGKGCYTHYRNYLFIIIRKGLSKSVYFDVAGHELGHHFLNHLGTIGATSIAFNPTATRHGNLSRYMEKLIEVEADYFSALMSGLEVKND